MASNLRTGIIGVFALLLGGGSVLLLQPGELDNTFVCTATTEVGVFDRVSSTGYTAYPYPGITNGSKQCINRASDVKGVWEKCVDYAASKGLSCSDIVATVPNDPVPSGVILSRIEVCNRPSEGGFCRKATCFAD